MFRNINLPFRYLLWLAGKFFLEITKAGCYRYTLTFSVFKKAHFKFQHITNLAKLFKVILYSLKIFIDDYYTYRKEYVQIYSLMNFH